MKAEPCPFCGGDSVSCVQGQTYRWVVAVCDECGAKGTEVRGTRVDKALAIAEWNNRKVPV
jgi:Lar family restriction alleviation protein